MATKTAGFVNINYCVALCQNDLGDHSVRLRERIFQMIVHYLGNLNISHGDKAEVRYLQMDSEGLVDYSGLTDFVEWIKIGIPVNGKIWFLSVNNKILLRQDTIPAGQEALIFGGQDVPVTTGYYFTPHYYNGIYVDQLFGYGGGFSRSYFRDDRENLRLQFDTAVPNDYVVVEYKSTGIEPTGGTIIPRLAIDAIMAYVQYRLEKTKIKTSRGLILDAKQAYEEQEKKFIYHYFKKPSLQEYLNAISVGKKQGPKS